MDLNQAAWHMGLAVDDPAVAALMDDWGEIVSCGEGANPNELIQMYTVSLWLDGRWSVGHHPSGKMGTAKTYPAGTVNDGLDALTRFLSTE